jgi:bacterioferritin
MQGDARVIETLNTRLAEELTAVNQYLAHAEICGHWGYEHLQQMIGERSMAEVKHARWLIARILFLGGQPIVGHLNKVHIGADVPRIHRNDQAAEAAAIRGYNESIRLAAELGDYGSRELLETILREEEAHLDRIESQIDRIGQMGLPYYLVEQLD